MEHLEILFFPLLIILLLPFIKEEKRKILYLISFILSLIPFIYSVYLIKFFISNPEKEILFLNFKFFEFNFALSINSFSFIFIFLNNLLFPLIILFSINDILFRIKEFNLWLLLSQVAINGFFLSKTLIPFFIFWEFSIIPFYFLIGIWGGERKRIANLKFVFYTLISGAFLLAGIIGIETGGLEKYKEIIFLFFFIAFAIKIPLFPFHTWLPDAHTEAPTAGSVILAGMLLKLGGWGIYKLLIPLFPDLISFYKTLIIFLSIFSIFYGAIMSFAQEDLKRLIAYSSVSHMGFVVLGLAIGTKAGIQGAMLQMFNHGISTSALFILVGVLYKRTHTRMLSDYGGISGIVPYFTFYFVLFSIASVALPGTGNFISEILVIFASFKEKFSYGVILAFAPFFAALYMLKAVKKTLWGPLKKKELKYLQDLYLNERIVLFILMFFVFLVGLLPTTILYLLKGG